jgi:3-hydroxy-3-methylglutaryl CoA synthase
MTVGLVSYGAYVPPTRLPLGALGGRTAKDGGPEKAVAWNDEDAITMGVTAAVNCIRGFDRSTVDGVLFASTTQPFKEKQAAALIARALDLPRDVRTADYGGSLRAGTNALRGATDAVAAGSARLVLVVASDCRMGAPGSGVERNGGDAAVAFLVGDHDVIATLDESHAIAEEIIDTWRSEGDPFVHSWEERFVVQKGYHPALLAAVQGLFAGAGAAVADFAHVGLFAPDARSHAGAARALGVTEEQLQDPFFGRLGSCGVAFAPLQLAAALESAQPGERLLIVSYGDGAEALAFTATEHVEKLAARRGVSWHLERRRTVPSYDRYLKARNLDPREWETAGDPGLSATIHFRERDEDVSFKAQRCRACSTLQFPIQRVCETCFAKDDFELVRLSDRVGRVVTFTFDFFFPTPDPPTIVTVTDVDGARVHLQIVNVRADDVKLGLAVEFEFRCIHRVGGRPNYYWKGTPVPAGAPGD